MEITSNATQIVEPGKHVIFTDTSVSCNCSMIFREGSGLVKLRGLTSSQSRARFKVFFNANIAIPLEAPTIAPIMLAVTVDGEEVPITRMIITPVGHGEYFNVASCIYLNIPTGYDATLSITNVGDGDVSVQNANLIVERVA